MRDPHVETLHYRLLTTERVTFNNPPPLIANRNGYGLVLEAGELTVTLREHHATEEAAREAFEPFLLAWEIHHALWAGSSEISFEFERSVIVDRDPPPPPKPGEGITVHVKAGDVALGMPTRGGWRVSDGRRSSARRQSSLRLSSSSTRRCIS